MQGVVWESNYSPVHTQNNWVFQEWLESFTAWCPETDSFATAGWAEVETIGGDNTFERKIQLAKLILDKTCWHKHEYK